jgi:hypothetical protein
VGFSAVKLEILINLVLTEGVKYLDLLITLITKVNKESFKISFENQFKKQTYLKIKTICKIETYVKSKNPIKLDRGGHDPVSDKVVILEHTIKFLQ